ncbi:MAG: hypothetical protein HND56_12090 [Pseudomonadota bacterium]|nr:MAG: hypothetical protein HND56_12090 [Pseudomonadota bacterium]
MGVLMLPVNPGGIIVILPTALFFYAASLRELEKPDNIMPLLSQIANAALFLWAFFLLEKNGGVFCVFLMLLSAANIGHAGGKYQSHTDCDSLSIPLMTVTLFTAFFAALYGISGSVGPLFALALSAVSALVMEIKRRGITPTGKRLFYYIAGYLTVSLLSAYAVAAQKFSLVVLFLLVGAFSVTMQLARGWKLSLESVVRGSFFASLIFLLLYLDIGVLLFAILIYVTFWANKPQTSDLQEQQGWRFGTVMWMFVVGMALIFYLGVVAGRADDARLKRIAALQAQAVLQKSDRIPEKEAAP